jgi:hypothetical protein
MDRFLKILAQLWDVVLFFLPVLIITVVVAAVCYWFFVVLLPSRMATMINNAANKTSRGDAATADVAQAAADAAKSAAEELTQYLSWPTFVFMTSALGSTMGLILAMVGGFSIQQQGADATSLLGAVLSVVIVALTAAATLFGDSDKVGLRKPLGATAFLLCLVLTGLYWGFIQAAFGV